MRINLTEMGVKFTDTHFVYPPRGIYVNVLMYMDQIHSWSYGKYIQNSLSFHHCEVSLELQTPPNIHLFKYKQSFHIRLLVTIVILHSSKLCFIILLLID